MVLPSLEAQSTWWSAYLFEDPGSYLCYWTVESRDKCTAAVSSLVPSLDPHASCQLWLSVTKCEFQTSMTWDFSSLCRLVSWSQVQFLERYWWSLYLHFCLSFNAAEKLVVSWTISFRLRSVSYWATDLFRRWGFWSEWCQRDSIRIAQVDLRPRLPRYLIRTCFKSWSLIRQH